MVIVDTLRRGLPNPLNTLDVVLVWPGDAFLDPANVITAEHLWAPVSRKLETAVVACTWDHFHLIMTCESYPRPIPQAFMPFFASHLRQCHQLTRMGIINYDEDMDSGRFMMSVSNAVRLFSALGMQ